MNRILLRLTIAAAVSFGLLPLAAAQDKSTTEYQRIIEASKAERGVLVYGNLPERLWTAFRALLAETYPWIKLETTDQGAELWEKYFAESAARARTADIITTTAPDRFASFVDRGQLQPYASIEQSHLPEWSRQEPGLYTLSASPGILMYNRILVKTPPKSIADIAALARANPKAFDGRISTYNAAANPFGVAMFAAWLDKQGNSWETFEQFGAMSRPENGGATMREKVASGEYSIAFFLNAVSVPSLETPEMKRLIGWSYLADGTPVSLQGVGITKAAASPNSARLVLDLMLSKKGQIALAQGGLTPYRDDIAQNEVPFDTLATARQKVGDENLVFYSYARDKVSAWPQVVDRWKQVFQKR